MKTMCIVFLIAFFSNSNEIIVFIV